jgi:uncharacterized protein
MNEGTQKKYEHLQQILKELDSVVIGYSGGVDSTLLLKVAHDVLGDRALAVIGRSETYPSSEYQEAVAVAQSFGARYIEVTTEETDDLKFKENPPDRCYFCKSELFGKLADIAAREGIPWIADGSITDDIGDFRPGMKAKKEKSICSPLLDAGLSKEEVREISKFLSLSTWDKPSFACLASRFPYGFGITKENLSKIDRAEAFLRTLNFRNYRVRHHDDKTARIEVNANEIARLIEPEIRERITTFFASLGFTYITLDLKGYRRGSMNEVLSPDAKAKAAS